MTRRQELLMGREVGQIAWKLGVALSCMTCGIGKAIDVVGQRWGLVPYDWAGEEPKKFGHRCKNTTWERGEASVVPDGSEFVITDAEKNRRVKEIEAQLAAWAERNTDIGLGADEVPGHDPRLPVERDEELSS